MFAFLSNPVTRWITIALALGMMVYGGIKYIERNAKKDILLDIKEEELTIEERVKNATDSVRDDINDAIDFLRGR